MHAWPSVFINIHGLYIQQRSATGTVRIGVVHNKRGIVFSKKTIVATSMRGTVSC